MNYHELNAQELIHELSRTGRYPHPDLIKAIWEQRAETEPLLLVVFNEAFDDDWSDDDDPRWYRLVHVGKFLLSWQNFKAMPTFARLYGADDATLQGWCEWFEYDLIHFGPPIIPHLKSIMGKDSGNEWHYGISLSGSVLTKIATYYPETRDEITAIFRAQLPSPDAIPPEIDEMWGDWARELGELADETSREHILALDDAEVLTHEFFGRQPYLRDMNRGFKPQKPPRPYDIRNDYQKRYEWEQNRQKQIAREKKRQRSHPVRLVTPRVEPKVGRNAPCPCGSGKKYKKCHGRSGA